MLDLRSTTNIKLGLFVLALLIVSASLLYTNWLVRELRDDNLRFLEYNSSLLANALSADLQSKAYQEEQRDFLSFNANLYAKALSADAPSLDFAFNQIIKNISFPVIITVVEGGKQIIYAHRNVDIPDTLSPIGTKEYLLDIVRLMDVQNQPIPVLYQNREIMRIHFGRLQDKAFDRVVDEVIRTVNFPMILTSGSTPDVSAVTDHTLTLFEGMTEDEEAAFLGAALQRMDSKNEPVPVIFENETVMLIHYEDSDLIEALKWFPYIEFSIIGGFILLGLAGFQFIRKAERRGIWVGLSKETAHQLGTPLSSLMGWIELLREEEHNPQISKIIEEMDNDLDRLNQVAERFSKIGAGVKLDDLSAYDLLAPVLTYVQRRIPQWGKSIKVDLDCSPDLRVMAHAELFGWAIENLLKNAVDAIKSEEGSIKVSAQARGKAVIIRVSDNGEGIPLRDHKNIFRPGWSSKKRGWGLGLSLVERIIREYHHGDIMVESAPGEGTTFELSLKISSSP
jgi:signal transduction histidine kinase